MPSVYARNNYLRKRHSSGNGQKKGIEISNGSIKVSKQLSCELQIRIYQLFIYKCIHPFRGYFKRIYFYRRQYCNVDIYKYEENNALLKELRNESTFFRSHFEIQLASYCIDFFPATDNSTFSFAHVARHTLVRNTITITISHYHKLPIRSSRNDIEDKP